MGQSIYYRLYYRNAASDGADLGQAHPVQADTIAWEWKIASPAAGKTTLLWVFPRQAYPDVHFDATLNTNQTYRLEWRLQRATSYTCKVQLRVYDSGDVLRLSDGDFKTETFNAMNIPLSTRNPDLDCSVDGDFRTMEVGNNDPNTTIGPGQYVYWGGAGVSLTDWVGPYSPTGG